VRAASLGWCRISRPALGALFLANDQRRHRILRVLLGKLLVGIPLPSSCPRQAGKRQICRDLLRD